MNSTVPSSPPPECATGTRSVWGILGTCGATLLICVWQTLHPNIPDPEREWHKAFLFQVGYVLLSFFAPEVVVGNASRDWCQAHNHVRKFRDDGYEWSMAHGYFGHMKGLVYHDELGESTSIDSHDFLRLCEEGKIANPFITEKEINGKSKSDVLGKAIFGLQLFWFMLQVVVRASRGLAVTLVELDTVCMAVLALVYLFFWWDKPLRPQRHIFYYTPEKKEYSRAELSKAWKAESSYLQKLIAYVWRKLRSVSDDQSTPPSSLEANKLADDFDSVPSEPGRLTAVAEALGSIDVMTALIIITWAILGGLHLIAWDFEFPTETEKTIWRIASLTLAGSLLPMAVFKWITWDAYLPCGLFGLLSVVFFIFGIVARALLVGLMLASLRALPSSAYETVSWTAYIPHL